VAYFIPSIKMNNENNNEIKNPFHEFALLMALLMSIVSFSIDAVLPALGEIGKVFTLQNSNQAQWVIIGIFSGMTIGQLIAGPLSDAIGRKRILFTGIRHLLSRKLVVLFHTKF
jgi:MFS family permease